MLVHVMYDIDIRIDVKSLTKQQPEWMNDGNSMCCDGHGHGENSAQNVTMIMRCDRSDERIRMGFITHCALPLLLIGFGLFSVCVKCWRSP